jgi:heme/copper-type cytochrome/quinol oxidase subunit 4
MEQHNDMPEGHLHLNDQEYSDGRKEVLKTIIILSIVTVVEVSVAIIYDHFNPTGGSFKWMINLFMAVMSVVKVIYIMGTFMHLKNETKGFFLTVLLPFMFLIWAIIAFSYEGGSWNHMRSLLNVF